MQSQHLKWYLLALLSLIWGSSFILIKKGLVGLTAFQLGSLRIIFCTLFLLLVGFKSLKNIARRQWKYLALTGLFGTFLPVYLFSFAETQIDSSVSAVLNSLTPLFTLIIGATVFAAGFQRRQFFGVVIGLGGCLLLIYDGAVNNPGRNYYYALLVIIAAACYATNINLIKKYLSGLSPMSIATGNFMVILPPALIILFCSGFVQAVSLPATQLSMLYIAVLAILGTGIANIVFFRLIHMSSPVFASSVTYTIPVVALVWGLIDNEAFTYVQGMGAAVILVGVYFSARK